MSEDFVSAKLKELTLDAKKWRLFLPGGELTYRPDTGYTIQGIWELRLGQARDRLKYADYQGRFPPDKFPRMLMIGAGTGAEIKAAQEFGYKATGIGFVPFEQLEYAKQQGVDFRIMDMHDLKFPNESFDIVYADSSFEHCLHPWLVCVEVWAVLRPYGRWWLNLPTWQASDKDGPTNQHFMVLPPWFMKPMFMRSGFRVIHFEDNEVRYQYLLEKIPMEEMTKLINSGEIKKSIQEQLRKRLELGVKA